MIDWNYMLSQIATVAFDILYFGAIIGTIVIIILDKNIRSRREGLFWGAECKIDGDYFYFGEVDGIYFFVPGWAGGRGEKLDISIYEREIECGVNEVFGWDKFGMVGRG